jgi:hypothetical protein
MKTIIFLIVLCIIFAFSTNNVKAQKETGTQEFYNLFTPEQVPCLDEVVSGPVTEYQSFTNNTYHVQARDIIYGETSKEPYEISYQFNAYWPDRNASIHWVMLKVLKHDGKLVAVILMERSFLYNGQGVEIIERRLTNVNCK